MSAVIGISSSSASQTWGDDRCSDFTASRGSRYSRDELRRLPRRAGRLRPGEALDDAREAVRAAAADDPLEQASVLTRHVERRVACAHPLGRVRQPQQVAVRHALALAVLDRLVRERVRLLSRVPAADRPPQRAAPAAEALDERRELEQVRARSADERQRVERGLPRRLVVAACRHREREDRRVVLRRAALLGSRGRSPRPRAGRPRRGTARPPSRSRRVSSPPTRSSSRPPSRGSRKRRSRVQSSTAHAKPPAEFGTWPEPGIGADCGTRLVPIRFRYDITSPFRGHEPRSRSRAKLRLGREPGAEALERGDEGLDLVLRVLAERRRVHRELEVDLVRAVGDPQLEPRRRQRGVGAHGAPTCPRRRRARGRCRRTPGG